MIDEGACQGSSTPVHSSALADSTTSAAGTAAAAAAAGTAAAQVCAHECGGERDGGGCMGQDAALHVAR